jgi:TetR/AcrR family transcriptional repressor of nem operon
MASCPLDQSGLNYQTVMGRTSDARQRLTDAAYDLIWEHSYGAVTIDAICERAGVKKGSFYYFFDSKSDLAVAALDAWWVQRKPIIDNFFRPEAAPLDRLRGYLDFISERQVKTFETTGQVLGCPIFTLGSEISTQEERIRSRICFFLDFLTDNVERAISEGQASGEIEGRDARTKAQFFMAYFEGVLTRARIQNDPALLLRLSSNALEVIGARTALASV